MTDSNAAETSVRLERTFDAPVDLVWQMWTDPEHFAAWYGPDGVTVQVAAMDVRVGGSRLVGMSMSSPRGPMQMWFAGEYVEVAEPRRLVYTEFMSDEQGIPLPAAVPEGHPSSTEVTVELTGAGDRTGMVLTHAGIPADSPGATGWTMALDKLVARLAAAPRA